MERPPSSGHGPAPASALFPAQEGVPFSSKSVAGDSNRTRGRSSMMKKKAVASLLNEIASLKEEDLDIDAAPEVPAHAALNERIKNLTSMVDDRLQNEGAALFDQFNMRVCQVDEQLIAFVGAVAPLGVFVDLIASSYHLRARLQQILHLFRKNASEAFPGKTRKEQAEPFRSLSSIRERLKPRKPAVQLLPGLTNSLEEFPAQLELLANDLATFLHFLQAIPQFRDESLSASILSCEADLKCWASCFREYEGQFGFPPIKQYVNDLTSEIDDHMEAIQDALRLFIVEGVTMIKTAQNRTMNGFQNLSTLATFLSGVTASSIQYTFNEADMHLGRITNALWMISLVFSISSAINSLLAYQFHATMYRSPLGGVRFAVRNYIIKSPLSFLVISLISYSAGLVCFVYPLFHLSPSPRRHQDF